MQIALSPSLNEVTVVTAAKAAFGGTARVISLDLSFLHRHRWRLTQVWKRGGVRGVCMVSQNFAPGKQL